MGRDERRAGSDGDWASDLRNRLADRSVSDAASYPSLVPGVLLAEDAFQVVFLTVDYAAPHDDEDEGKQQRGPKRVDEYGNSAVHQREAQVERVASEAVGP